MYIIAGLGNPGEGYEKTRHNTGRILVADFRRRKGFSEWEEDANLKAHVSSGKIEKSSVKLVLPDTFMNRSGSAVKQAVKDAKAAEKLIVVYDDLDLPLGTFKIAFARGSGGHKGVESVARSIRTKNFVRVRVGIAPTTPSGKLRKPKGEKQVLHFIMDSFSRKEEIVFKKVSKQVSAALEVIITRGRQVAMNEFN